MRVVAGKYRGKNLASPKDDNVRPTTTRIKETIFNIIQFDVEGSKCLDLFCGSGSLGIECISRGAKEVVFVDKSKDSIELTNLNLKGIEGNYKVYLIDFLSALKGAHNKGEKFDIIFLDPPYKSTLAELAIEAILDLDLLEEDGQIIYEHSSEKNYTFEKEGYKCKTKVMGSVTCEFIKKKHIALMCGSFDPITKGHEAILDEALRFYDEVVVACLINEEKTYTFTNEQRLELVKAVCDGKKGARAMFSTKYAVEVAKEVGAETLIRGIRSDADMSYEEEMKKYNEEHGFSTRFIEIDSYKDVSSTLVREQIKKGDYRYVPAQTIYLIEKYIKD